MIKVFLILFIISMPVYVSAAWYLHQPQATDSAVALSDSGKTFKLGVLNCGVTATQFLRNPDDSVIETRELYCWTDKDTRVSVWGNCQKPDFTNVSLQFKRGKESFLPSLVCGPKKKE
jgi:hypothetical protein